MNMLCLSGVTQLTNREIFYIMVNKCKSYDGDLSLDTTHPKLTEAQEAVLQRYRDDVLLFRREDLHDFDYGMKST